MSQQNQIETTVVDGVTVLSFPAQKTSLSEDVLEQVSPKVVDAAERGTPKFLIDFENVAFFSSSFIEVMFRVWRRNKVREGSGFALCCLAPYCKEILEITNLDKIWPMYETREAAIAALNTDAPADESSTE